MDGGTRYTIRGRFASCLAVQSENAMGVSVRWGVDFLTVLARDVDYTVRIPPRYLVVPIDRV